MFRLPSLPWTTFGGDKMTPESVKVLSNKHRKSPSIESPKMQKLKRKRVENGISDGNSSGPPPKKLNKHPQVVIPIPPKPIITTEEKPTVNAVEGNSESLPSHGSTSQSNGVKDGQAADSARLSLTEAQVEKLRAGIEWQMNQEILLKHNELRLIDQEIAKCQIALEQLRRCSEIPYPAMRTSDSVSNGTGPALRTSMRIPPESPAPWGVTDGPYSRHYARWLLPDPRFDGSNTMPPAVSTIPAGKIPTKGRSTRGSFNDGAASSLSRPGRGGAGSKMQSLPSGYPQPRDKTGPMIQKRKSDGAMVKLVCLDCRRDNFNSAQGFINHCRIAHQRNFTSHDAAADACGEPVEVDEAGAVIGGDTAPATAGLVHPLIRSAHLFKKSEDKPAGTEAQSKGTPSQISVNAATESDNGHGASVPQKDGVATPSRRRGRKPKDATVATPPTFKPSPLTPNLSAFMRGQGSALDLEDIVGDARAPVDFHEVSSSESDSEEEFSTPEATPGRLSLRGAGMQLARRSISPLHTGRQSPGRSLEKEQRFQPLENAKADPVQSADVFGANRSAGNGNMLDIEPSPTNDSNQAPSLVSDDEDYEAHSGSETSSSTSGSHADVEIEVEDNDSTSGGQSTRSSAEDSEYSGVVQDDQATQPRRTSAFRRGFGKREEKHVTFVSPSPVREMAKKRGGRRKKTS